jgi:hypothetical protein
MNRETPIARITLCVVLLAALVVAAPAPSSAATVPAWLDDAITAYNQAHPEGPIEFVAIKDSYVWYRTAAVPEITSKEIRARIHGITEANGYEKTSDEEMVTTGRPPVTGGAARTVKCWTRSYLRDPMRGSTGISQRMLTTMVCEEGGSWAAGFRILE